MARRLDAGRRRAVDGAFGASSRRLRFCRPIVVVAPESEIAGELTELRAEFGVPVDDIVRAVPDSFAPMIRVVLVHDPLRAFAPPSSIRRVVEAVLVADTPVVPVLPCSDTVKLLDDHRVVIDTPDRAGLRVVQTPLGYPARLIRLARSWPATCRRARTRCPATRRLNGSPDRWRWPWPTAARRDPQGRRGHRRASGEVGPRVLAGRAALGRRGRLRRPLRR